MVHIRTRGTGFVEDTLEHPSDASRQHVLSRNGVKEGSLRVGHWKRDIALLGFCPMGC